MILSDKDLKQRIIQDHQEAEQAKEWWEKGEWDKVGNKIVIDPFETNALSPCCYDLSIGEEYISLRDPYNTHHLKEGEHFTINPGEAVLVLTEEYICLPRNVLAMVIPSARWIFEGTALYSSRVEPTWYGKLLIAVTNLAKQPIALTRGRGFCTCYFMEVSETEGVLSKKEVPHLGRTHAEVEFRHTRPQELLPADKVDQSDIEKVVALYGWPWDVVRGMFALNQKLLKDYIDKELYSNLLEDAVSATTTEVHKEVTHGYRTIIYVLVGFGVALVGLIGYLFYLLLSSP
ncbi:dCTP deaminase, dUMP-forming [subsurface metagenome]